MAERCASRLSESFPPHAGDSKDAGDVGAPVRLGGGFRAFSAQDWNRIETVTPQLRQVGLMMQRCGRALVSPPTEEAPRLQCVTQLYAHLCQLFQLETLEVAVGPPNKPTRGKVDVRQQAEARVRKQDESRIRQLQGRLPRWDTAQNRWEWYIVAFRVWLARPSGALELCIKLTTAEDLLDALPDGPRRDIESDVRALSKSSSFEATLRVVASDEHVLVRAKADARGLALYAEQEEVATALLVCMRARLQALSSGSPLPALLVRFCTPPSTGKSSAAAYLGAMLDHFCTQEVNRRGQTPHLPRPYR